MIILPQLKSFKKCVIQHIDELADPKSKQFFVFSIVEDSQEIWAGLGDRERIVEVSISPNGWNEHRFTRVTGEYQRRGNGISDQSHTIINDETVEQIINGNHFELDSMRYFLKLLDDLSKKYPNDIRV